MNDLVRIGIFSSLADEIDEFKELIDADGKIFCCWINSSCSVLNDGRRIWWQEWSWYSLSNEYLRFNGAWDNSSTNNKVGERILFAVVCSGYVVNLGDNKDWLSISKIYHRLAWGVF